MMANASPTFYVVPTSDVVSSNLSLNVTAPGDNGTDVTFLEEAVGEWLWRVVTPVLFLGGTLGNILVMLTLTQMHFSKSSTLVHLMVLAGSDTTVLATVFSRYWIRAVFGFDVRTISNAGCKLHLFVIYLSMDYSSWILVSVTVERLISVYYPLHVRRWCTVPRGLVRLTVIFFFLVVVNGHYFWTNAIIDGDCNSVNAAVFYFEEFVFVWIDFFFLCLAPFVIMFVCDCFMIYALRQAHKMQQSTIANMSQVKNGGRSGKTLHVGTTTRMLITVTFFFFATTLPITVYFITESFVKPGATDLVNARLDLAWTVAYLLQYSNYACNFLLYSARNRRFRRQLLHLLHIRRLSSHPPRSFRSNSEFNRAAAGARCSDRAVTQVTQDVSSDSIFLDQKVKDVPLATDVKVAGGTGQVKDAAPVTAEGQPAAGDDLRTLSPTDLWRETPGHTWAGLSSSLIPDYNSDPHGSRSHPPVSRSRSGGSLVSGVSGLSCGASTVLTMADLPPGNAPTRNGHRPGADSPPSSGPSSPSNRPASDLGLADSRAPSGRQLAVSNHCVHDDARGENRGGEAASERETGKEGVLENDLATPDPAPSRILTRYVREALRSGHANQDDVTANGHVTRAGTDQDGSERGRTGEGEVADKDVGIHCDDTAERKTPPVQSDVMKPPDSPKTDVTKSGSAADDVGEDAGMILTSQRL